MDSEKFGYVLLCHTGDNGIGGGSSTAQCPEEVGIGLLVRCEDLACWRDDFEFENLFYAKTVLVGVWTVATVSTSVYGFRFVLGSTYPPCSHPPPAPTVYEWHQ